MRFEKEAFEPTQGMPANAEPKTNTFGAGDQPRVDPLLKECKLFAKETFASASGPFVEHKTVALAQELYAKFWSIWMEEGIVTDIEEQLFALKTWLRADKDDGKRNGILTESRFHPYRSATEPPTKSKMRVV